jgi:peptide/nickel transport system substrate-binding protein
MSFDRWVRSLCVAAALVCGLAHAATLRVADAGDALSMDPHSLWEGVQLSVTGNIYEPLVGRGKDMSLVPALATRWTSISPTVWRFELRRGVRFHDGTPFTADDVVFSFKRAAAPGSDVLTITAPIKGVRKVDDFTVDIETLNPLPTLPDTLPLLYIMSRTWCEANHAENPVDRRKGVENTASFKANGTGPYRLRERQPSVRTVLARNADHWEHNRNTYDEVVFMPIASEATRVAALLSGEVDVMEPVPPQDVQRIKSTRGFAVLQGPELRTIFLGMDQKRDELLYSSVKGRNPFKDRRVRQAFYQAIDIEAIRSRIMRGAATPTALLIGPGVRGFQPDMNKRLPYDPLAAKALLTQAGYPDGFDIVLNCPNDRYVNDAQICLAVAANLARIGVKVTVQAESKTLFFPRLLRRDTSFYLSGYTPGTVDVHEALSGMMATRTETGQGTSNSGGYSNPEVDELLRKIQSEMNDGERNRLIREVFRIQQDDVAYIPLHQQALAWAFTDRIKLVQMPHNFMAFKWITPK